MSEQEASRPTPMVRGRFSQLNLITSDMSAAVGFFGLLGIEVAEIPAPWDAHHRTVANVAEQFTVEFDSQLSVRNWAGDWIAPPTTAVIGIAVDADDDVDRAVAIVAAHGYPILQPAHDAFFGARYAVVQGPDGCVVGIMGPVRPGRHWMPDAPG